MDGTKTHPLALLGLEQLKKSAPGLFKKCPYEEKLEVNNVTSETLNSNEAFMFLEGTYRMDLFIYRNLSLSIKLFMTSEVKSAIKHSFGKFVGFLHHNNPPSFIIL